MIGIVFKDVDIDLQPLTRTVKFKLVANEPAVAMEKDILYPTMELSPVENLICNENDPTFDEERWSLLRWLLSLNKDIVAKIMTSDETKFIKIVSLTTEFLLKHRIISAEEAEVILQVELNCQTKRSSVRRIHRPPVMPRFAGAIEKSWVQICHKYTISFELVCHCLELCGMRQHTELIQFDAFEFHNRMRSM
ncbi:uncharacterized protein LOC116338187 [Contarinia nasturtii]|uniref:uncharacterized protein LOC116338187 n=1 Tax=Contarinia nasturtii TaxID=265458 RepID=UPI0012D3AEEC|nr:uncharacterized protein LOC116338187 [Contarinia nasturtii]